MRAQTRLGARDEHQHSRQRLCFTGTGRSLLFDSIRTNRIYLHEHDWRLLGRATLLAPVGMKAAKATFSRGRPYPADPWELRTILVLEATPKVPSHPYGKRVLYIDEQMGVPLYVLAFDQQGRHYKTIFTLYGNPAFSPGNEQVRAPLWLGHSVVNHLSHQASVAEMNRVVMETRVQEDLFTIGQLAQLAR